MERWFENPKVDESVVISSRVRLARNIKKYPFPSRLSEPDAKNMLEEISKAIISDRNPVGTRFKFFDLSHFPPEALLSFMERHAISSLLVAKPGPKGVVINDEESVSIMINEEDHTRIQSIFPGDNIDSAFEMSNKIDDLIEENANVEYAFEQDFGYLTSCPTNAGTGMRASLMLHIPTLEASHYLSKLAPALGKFGMTLRGIHGEGSESMGSIYQLSNQVTLGKTEQEIITALKTAALQIINQEKISFERAVTNRRLDIVDRFYRSYGILKNCRKLTLKEGMNLLSDVRLGFMSKLYDGDMEMPKKTIYKLMMDIQPGSISFISGKKADTHDLDAIRADYIRSII